MKAVAGGDGFERARRRIGLPGLLLPQQVMVSSVRIAHESKLAAVTVLNVPDGASVSTRPQQVRVSSLRTPHECQMPAETVLNVPDGASVCPALLSPQQVIVSSLRTAHECAPPAETVGPHAWLWGSTVTVG